MPSYHAPFDLLNEFITLLLNAPSSEWGNIAAGFNDETRKDLIGKLDARIGKANRLRVFLGGEVVNKVNKEKR